MQQFVNPAQFNISCSPEGYINPAELKRKLREDLIAKRAKQEQKFANWKRAMLTCGEKEVLEKLPIDINTFTYESLFPELYKDRIDKDVYKQELERANQIIMQITEIVNEYNKKGVELLVEFDKMKS